MSSVSDAHRTARLAMRQQEKVFAKAAKKRALRDQEAAAEAARVAAAAARIAANERFRVVEKKTTKIGYNAKGEVEENEDEEEGSYRPGQIVAPKTATRRKHWGERFAADEDSDDDGEEEEEIPTKFLGAAARARSSRVGMSLHSSQTTRQGLALVR